jgi:peroxiredoxin
MKKTLRVMILLAMAAVLWGGPGVRAEGLEDNIYQVDRLKPVDSQLKVRVGDPAPDFTLPSVSGKDVRLSDYRGRKNVVLSFIPAAWTPVCSDQWPGYNVAEKIFTGQDAVLLGISVDNIPTLFAWTKQMSEMSEMGGLWYPVLSDFWPHGGVAEAYGILRSNGVTERALFVIDKKGVIRYIDVHDINERPDLNEIAKALKKLN